MQWLWCASCGGASGVDGDGDGGGDGGDGGDDEWPDVVPQLMDSDDDCESISDDEEERAEDGFPQFTPANNTPFSWGKITGTEFIEKISLIYELVSSTWSKNLFMVPSGKFGKEFCRQKTILINSFATAGPMESIAFKAVAVMDPPKGFSVQRSHQSTWQKTRVVERW